MRLHQRKMETQAEIRFLEAPVGIEPTNKGFADPPLSHLGTAPRLPNYTPNRVQVFQGGDKKEGGSERRAKPATPKEGR
jgi:hypothetical protein